MRDHIPPTSHLRMIHTLFLSIKTKQIPPFYILFDTETLVSDEDGGKRTLLLGSYAIVIIFSENIIASTSNGLEHFTIFRSKKMNVRHMGKIKVPRYMLSTLDHEDVRAVKRPAVRVHHKGTNSKFWYLTGVT